MAQLKDKLVILEALKELKDYIEANFTSEVDFTRFISTDMPKAISDEIAKIVAGAPARLDTLKEISDWISSHETSAASMNSAIQNKVDKEDGKSLFSGKYSDLSGKPSIPSIDKTLKVVGAGADAKATGDAITALETRLKSGSIDDAELHLGLYIDADGDICQKED